MVVDQKANQNYNLFASNKINGCFLIKKRSKRYLTRFSKKIKRIAER